MGRYSQTSAATCTFSGAPDERWNNDELRELLQVKASDFEVVKFNN